MSKRRVVRFVIRSVASVAVFGATAVTLAGVSAYAMRSTRVVDEAMNSADNFMEPQTSNRAAKSARLASLVPIALTTPEQAAPSAPAEQPAFSLASAQQGTDLGRFYDTVTAAAPMLANVEPTATPAEMAAPTESPAAESKQAALAPAPSPAPMPAPLPHEKPKRPASPPQSSGMLDDGQIAGLKSRLRLTQDQIEYWPAVEAALRDVARTQMRGFGGKHAHAAAKVNIDVNSPEVQKLIWAAMPLLMRLRDDQKSEVRKLARIMGLEQVASQI